jgi:hypothetical protein
MWLPPQNIFEKREVHWNNVTSVGPIGYMTIKLEFMCNLWLAFSTVLSCWDVSEEGINITSK